MTKTVCQLDEAGYFVGVVDADESPLEPGVYLIPRGAVDADPPLMPPGQRARWAGEWLLEPDTAPELEPEPGAELTFTERQGNMIHDVDLTARDKRNAIVEKYSPAEMASWPIKRAEAIAFLSSSNALDAPSLSLEADERDISLAELASLVLNKAAVLSNLEARIAGYSGRLQDRIRAVDDGDHAGLDLININEGWPV